MVTKRTSPCYHHPGQEMEPDQHFIIITDEFCLSEISKNGTTQYVIVMPRFFDLTLL